MRLKAFVFGFLAMGVAVSSAHARGMTECTMKYNLKGWSAFYKTAAGTEAIRCDNGQKANVRLSARGGGLTAGKTEIRDGMGSFSRVASIDGFVGGSGVGAARALPGRGGGHRPRLGRAGPWTRGR